MLLVVLAAAASHKYMTTQPSSFPVGSQLVSPDSGLVNQRPITLPPLTSTTLSSSDNGHSILPTLVHKPSSPSSDITAEAYLVGNLDTGQIYLSKNIHMARPIASISKTITTLVAEANMDTDERVTITQPMLDVYPDSMGIQLGETFTVGELLYPLILESNNNVAEGLAMAYSQSPADIVASSSSLAPQTSDETAFVNKMNQFATAHGMTETHFADASGLSDENVSSPSDLFTLAQYLYRERPDFLTLSRTPSFVLAETPDHLGHTFSSTNVFVGDPHFLGGKTGRTNAAGETMLSLFTDQVNGKTYPFAIIVLHSDEDARQVDSENLYLKVLTSLEK